MNSPRIILMLITVVMTACSGQQQDATPATLSISGTLGSQFAEGYQRAYEPRSFTFPDDHGAHTDFKNEWWYFTGNVKAENGREFGYQFTLFRTAIAPDVPVSDSAWATNQIYLAHAALSDISNGRFYSDERFSRGAMGLAGVATEPFHAWLDDWSVQGDGNMHTDRFSVSLSVVARGFSLQLQLQNTKAMVLQGNQGLSAKSPAPGNASYYISYTRLQTAGTLHAGDQIHSVMGESWFDHEWSTSALEDYQSGWDWFSLQLPDQTELMLFQLRHKTDVQQHYYSGSLIHNDGRVEVLHGEDFSIRVTDHWLSPATGIRYPIQWRVELGKADIRLIVAAKMPNQEMNTSYRYWEGAVQVSGSMGNKGINGKGYVELTGYQ